jgi:hypothetical protein
MDSTVRRGYPNMRADRRSCKVANHLGKGDSSRVFFPWPLLTIEAIEIIRGRPLLDGGDALATLEMAISNGLVGRLGGPMVLESACGSSS